MMMRKAPACWLGILGAAATVSSAAAYGAWYSPGYSSYYNSYYGGYSSMGCVPGTHLTGQSEEGIIPYVGLFVGTVQICF